VAKDTHLMQLQQGVDAWNRWRDEHSATWPDLRGADLSEAQLHGADLREADLREANLFRTHLRRARLLRAHLHRANLKAADLRGAHLGGADLSEADLSSADLRRAHIHAANLHRTDLSEADLYGAHLRGANLHGAHLRRANLGGADLRGANLSEADLSGADLSGANLHGADLNGANLSGTDLRTTLGSYSVETTEQREIEVEIALPQENISYLDLEQLQMAIDNLMEVCEFELKGELDPIRGSWWQTLIFWSKNKTTQTAVNRLFQTLKEVLVARSIGIPSAEETTKLTEAVDRVLKSLEPFDRGIIRLGKLLIIKHTLRGTKLVIISFTPVGI
jgi:uncharacterized protein YjbI with pentapeptide repeats